MLTNPINPRSPLETLIICDDPMTHSGNAPPLVYVRRKPEVETPSASITPTPALNDEATQKQVDLKAPASPILDSPQNQVDLKAQASPILDSPPPPISSAKSPSNMLCPAIVNAKQWEARVCQFNDIFNKLDLSDQKDYIHMLRSLSSIELSKQAVDLENRAIQLSIDEAKEIERAQVLDVLERYSKHS